MARSIGRCAVLLAVVFCTTARAENLADLIPGLYGGDGIILAPALFGGEQHAPHFTSGSLAAINQLNSQISREVRALPIGTSSPGARSYEFNEELGTYELVSRSLGPVLAEESRTIGKRNISFATTASVFSYDRFDGQALSRITVVSRHQPDVIGDPNQRELFENDVIDIDFDVNLDVQIVQLFGTYGITDRWDVSVVVPLIRVELEANSLATIVVSPENPVPDLHGFDTGAGSDQPADSASGSATGVGDVIVGTKYWFGEFGRVSLAGQMQWKTSSGDEQDFQGTGSNTITPSFIADVRISDFWSATVNVGYEWDDDDSLEDSLRTVVALVGGDSRLTGAIEYSGRFQLRGDGIGDNKSDLSVGLKWNPWRSLVGTVGVIVPLNDEGLRSDLVTSIGLSYNL